MKSEKITIEKSKPKATNAVLLFDRKGGKMHNREYDAMKGRIRKGKYREIF